MSSGYQVTISMANWAQFQDMLQAIVYTVQVFRDTIAKDKRIQIHIREWDIRIDLVPEPPK